jgi:hypothetical protein
VRPDLPRHRGNAGGQGYGNGGGPTPMELGVMGMRRHAVRLSPRLAPQGGNRHMARLSTNSRNIMQAVSAGPFSNRPPGNNQGAGGARWGNRRQGAAPQGAAARYPSQGNGQRRRQ